MVIIVQALKWRKKSFSDNKKFYMGITIGEKKTQVENAIKIQVLQGSQMKWVKAMQMIKVARNNLRERDLGNWTAVAMYEDILHKCFLFFLSFEETKWF